MQLKRKQKIIVPQLEASTERITNTTIDFQNETVVINRIAVDDDGNTIATFQPVKLQNVPESRQAIQETITVKDGKAALQFEPLTENVIKAVFNGKLLEATTDYFILGIEVTFLTISNGQNVHFDYMRLLPAITDFTDFINTPNTAKAKKAGDALRRAEWLAMSKMGIVEGDIK